MPSRRSQPADERDDVGRLAEQLGARSGARRSSEVTVTRARSPSRTRRRTAARRYSIAATAPSCRASRPAHHNVVTRISRAQIALPDGDMEQFANSTRFPPYVRFRYGSASARAARRCRSRSCRGARDLRADDVICDHVVAIVASSRNTKSRCGTGPPASRELDAVAWWNLTRSPARVGDVELRRLRHLRIEVDGLDDRVEPEVASGPALSRSWTVAVGSISTTTIVCAAAG